MRNQLLLLIGGVLAVFALLFGIYFLLIEMGGDNARIFLIKSWEVLRITLTTNGPLLFFAIALLPGFVLPVAPLLGLAGLWGGENGPWISCMYCSLALTANLSWTYWLAKGPARGLIERILRRTRFRLPSSPPKNMLEWALILRLTPGVPFIFTNYALGLIGMGFNSYLFISIPILTITASGYVLAFAGIFGGEWKYLWTGACLIAVTLLLGRFILKRKKGNAD